MRKDLITEYDYEGLPGLPGKVPPSEKILWQGSPSWRHLAINAFHVRKVAIYFALLAAWQVVSLVDDGETWVSAISATYWAVPAATIAIGLLAGVAWMTARTTMYTITNNRIVMRYGIALPVALNVPFTMIDRADLHAEADGNGDIPVTLAKGERIAYLVLWPHARRWHFSNPQPMLRCISGAAGAAEILSRALADQSAQTAVRVAKSAARQKAPTVSTGSGQPAAA